MINLLDYFHAWSLGLFGTTMLLFFAWEIIGTSVNYYFIKLPTFLRPVYWFIGLSLLVLEWFFLHFFISFTQTAVILSILPLVLVSLPFYFKFKGYQSLLGMIKGHPWPLLVVLVFVPIIFVKTSLPPYYFDEMAYQYWSPNSLVNMKVWDFYPGGLYQNIPRLLNTAYYLLFALTKTYVPARLLHFLLFFSVFYSISLWLRQRIGLLVSLGFLLFYFFLPIDLLVPATLGYIDIASISVICLAIISGLDFLLERNAGSLMGMALMWGLAIGIKYTSFIPMVAHLSIFLLYYFLAKSIKKFSKTEIVKIVIKCGLVLVVFGGYWEIKNLIMFYNPIYPFLFGCKQTFVQTCPTGSGLFTGWTTPIIPSQFGNIITQLFASSKIALFIFVLNLILLLFQRNKKILTTIMLILGGITLEFVLMAKISGFYMRYAQHIQILLILVSCLQISSFSSRLIVSRSRIIYFGFSVLSILLILKMGYRQVRYVYSSSYMPKYEIDFALGRTDLSDWINLKFPRMHDFIYFCSNPPEGKVFNYVNVDPDLIWFEYDGMARVFNTNCYIQGSPVDSFKPEMLVAQLKKLNESFYFTSINKCLAVNKIKFLGYENNQQKKLRLITNELVCNSREVIPSLYYFDAAAGSR